MFHALLLALALATCYEGGSATCHTKYSSFLSSHSQCITQPSTDLVQEFTLSQDEKNEIVAEHNRIRGLTEASNMMRMQWNDDIASSALKYASLCTGQHETSGDQRREPGKYAVGQNIAKGSQGRFQNWTSVVQYWAEEISVFNADRTYSSVAGHYSAIIWASTSMVGCAKVECNEGGSVKEHYYCNYAPSGNFPNVPAYNVAGGVCSECGTSRCSDNLCDCGTDNGINACMNSGTLNLQTCGCSCSESFYDASQQCALTSCANTDTSGLCGFPASYCSIFSNIPDACPALCNICPYSASNYGS